MGTIKANGTYYYVSSSKITTPSIKIVGTDMVQTIEWHTVDLGGGHTTNIPNRVYKPMQTTSYIPLFVGNKGSTVDYNRYRYTLGGLKIGNYHAATSREFINHAPTATLSASATRVPFRTNVTYTCTASDPDGDQLTYEWHFRDSASNGEWVNNTGSTPTYTYSYPYSVTQYVYVVVRDPYGGSVTTNTVSVTWYDPNHAPYITIGNTPGSSSYGNIKFTISYHDDDSDACTVQYGYRTANSSENTQRSFTTGTSPSNATIYVAVNAPVVYGYYRIFARITDSKGASDVSYRDILYVAPPDHAYKCKVECYRVEETESSDSPYAGRKKDAWYASITPIKYPSQYAGLEIISYNSSTVTIRPYAIEPRQVTKQVLNPWGYGYREVTVTENVQVPAGTAHTFAVTFPSDKGRQYAHTFTFEWD